MEDPAAAEEMRQLRRVRKTRAAIQKRRDAVESRKLREELERLRGVKTSLKEEKLAKWGGRQAVSVDHRKYSLSRRGGKATLPNDLHRHERARRAVDRDFSPRRRHDNEKENSPRRPAGGSAGTGLPATRVAVLYERGRTKHVEWSNVIVNTPPPPPPLRRAEGIVAGWKGKHAHANEISCQVFATSGDERSFAEKCKRLIATIPLVPYCDGASLSESSKSQSFAARLRKEESEIWCAVGGLSSQLEISRDGIEDDPFLWTWNAMHDEDGKLAEAQLKAACRVFVEDTKEEKPNRPPPLRQPHRSLTDWASPFILNVDGRVRVSLWRGSGVTRRRIDSVDVDRSIVCGGLLKNDILRFSNSTAVRYRGIDDDRWLKGGRRAQVFGWIAREGKKGKWAVYANGKLHVFRRRDTLRAEATIPIPECTEVAKQGEDEWLLSFKTSSCSSVILLSK